MAKLAEGCIPTGCPSLDRALGGGLPRGAVSLLYGEAGAGKTSLAVQCTVLCAKRGEKALYVDSGGGFNVERLAQMAAEALPEVMENLVVFTPQSFQEQILLAETIDRYVARKTTLAVFDTVTGLYRLELSGVHETFASNRQLNRMMAYLKQLAVARGVAVMAISQVRAALTPDASCGGGLEPVAQRVLNYWTSLSLRLSNTSRAGVKEWTIERAARPGIAGLHSLFEVADNGLRDFSEVTARSARSS
ncbi:MAG: ATPase domain-containing protein [Candidatus Bathyarchaeia archaeon]